MKEISEYEKQKIEGTDEWLVPVRMIDPDVCMECPDLEVKNQQLQMIEGKTLVWTNRLICEHYSRCRNLVNGLKKAASHEEHGS